MVFGFVLGIPCLAQISRSELEERFRIEVSQINDNINVDVPNHQPPLGDRLLALVKQAGFSRQEAQAILLKLIDEGMTTSDNKDALMKRRIAHGALSPLGDIADATVLDQIVRIAETAPSNLLGDAVNAAIKTASRVNPTELPAISHRLLKGPSQDRVYGLLSDVLHLNLPNDAVERDLRVKLIVGLFKEGLREPSYEDRIYLDKVIEEYDPDFRHSDERKRILQELAGSSNSIVKRYAEAKLQEYFIGSDLVAPTPSVGESKKQEPKATSTATPIVAPSNTNEAPSSADSNLNILFVVAGATVVVGLLGFFLWRRK